MRHLITLLLIITAGVLHAATGLYQSVGGSVNILIGDRSFAERFGRLPDEHVPDYIRIRTHLAYVEDLLRRSTPTSLPPALRAARLRNLDHLREYRERGIFPRNENPEGVRAPCFIDRIGTLCAVGHLVACSAGRAAAEEIDRQYRYAYISRMATPILDRWLAGSGLTREEAALIQPAYATAWPALTAGITVGAELAMPTPLNPPSFGAVPSTRRSLAITSGFFGGVDLAYRFNDRKLTPALSLGLRYDDRSFSITSSGPGADAINRFGISVVAPTLYSAAVDYRSITADLLLEIPVARNGWAISAGPTFTHLLAGHRTDRLSIETDRTDVLFPPDLPFPSENGGRSAVLRQEDLANGRMLLFGLRAGLRWPMSISRSITFTTSLWLDLPISSLGHDDPWRFPALQLGFGAQMPLLHRIVGDF